MKRRNLSSLLLLAFIAGGTVWGLPARGADDVRNFDLTTAYRPRLESDVKVPDIPDRALPVETHIQEVILLRLDDGREFRLPVTPILKMSRHTMSPFAYRNPFEPYSTISIRMAAIFHQLAWQQKTPEPPHLYPRPQPVVSR